MEMAASRILAPFFGTSLIVWASLIGVILTAMSIGSFFGGILADKIPAAGRTKLLGNIISVAALCVVFIGLTKNLFSVLFSAMGGGDLGGNYRKYISIRPRILNSLHGNADYN
jgi:MFS family permease